MQALVVLTWTFLGLCGYVYVGYPALLWICASLFGRPVRQGYYAPAVSFIVAAYNEADFIDEKIENTLNLNYPKDLLDIIVVTDGSSDVTPQIVSRYSDRGVRLVHSPERKGKSAALNRGIERAQGEILVFSDANALYDPDSLRKLLRNFSDAAVGCVSGRKTIQASGSHISKSEGAYWKYESFIKEKESLLGSTIAVVGEMIAIRRTLLKSIPENVVNDDSYIAMRVLQAGFRAIYEPEAVSRETSAASTNDEIIRRQRINAGRHQLLFSLGLWPWNNPLAVFELVSHKLFRLLLPLFMIGALVTNCLVVALGDWHVPMMLTLGAQIAFFSLSGIGLLAERHGWRLRLPGIAYYVVSGNVASLRGLIRYLRGEQTVLWARVARGPKPTA